MNHGLKGMEAVLHFPEEDCPIHEPIPGVHNIYNACAAACVGQALGLSRAEICAGISHAQTIAGRTNLIECGGLMIIDDCYNANPVSMRASLDVLALAEGRKIAVLGDMGELGENERELHRGVGAYAAAKGIDMVLCAGPLSAGLAEEAGKGCQTMHFATREELTEQLLTMVQPGGYGAGKSLPFYGVPEDRKSAAGTCRQLKKQLTITLFPHILTVLDSVHQKTREILCFAELAPGTGPETLSAWDPGAVG